MKGLYEDDRAIGTPKWYLNQGPRELPFSIGSACSASREHLRRSSENLCYFVANQTTLNGPFWFCKFRNEVFGGGDVTRFPLPCLVSGAVTVLLLSPVYSFSVHYPFSSFPADWLWIYRTLALVQSYWLRSYYWNNIAWEKPNLWKNHEI